MALALSGCVVVPPEPEPLTTQVSGLVGRTRFDDVKNLEAVMNTEERNFDQDRTVVWIGEAPLCARLSAPLPKDVEQDSPAFASVDGGSRVKALMLDLDGTAWVDTGEQQQRRDGTVTFSDQRDENGSWSGRFVASFVIGSPDNVQQYEGSFVASRCNSADIQRGCSTGSGVMVLSVLVLLLRPARSRSRPG